MSDMDWDEIDTVVVGAGAVGLACAAAIARSGREVIVLERETAIGQGVSSRNSEVIHAGLYYAPGSLKAALCVRGRDLLYALCARHGVAHQRCGKLVVASDEAQIQALDALLARGRANGVRLYKLTGPEAQALEPALQAVAALHSPDTGIVDSHGFMLAVQGELEAAGGVVAVASALASVVLDAAGGWHALRLQDGSGLRCRRLVNAAGLSACALAGRMAGLDQARVPTPRFAKGSYFTLAGRSPFRHLIYPAPQDAWLGVHLTLDLGGQARFGPDLEWLDVQDPNAIDYRVDPARAAGFEAAVRHYWPGLPDGALLPAYSGVRPKIHGPGEPAPDWRIDGPERHGVPGLVNLFGIESPGLTGALAIGEAVVGRLGLG